MLPIHQVDYLILDMSHYDLEALREVRDMPELLQLDREQHGWDIRFTCWFAKEHRTVFDNVFRSHYQLFKYVKVGN